jgi:hypothetical protein
MRESRGATLPMPRLILRSMQVNIRAGQLPEPEGNRLRHLKLPLDAFPGVPKQVGTAPGAHLDRSARPANTRYPARWTCRPDATIMAPYRSPASKNAV